MKFVIGVAFALVVLSGSAGAQAAPAVTPDMTAMEARLLTRIGPETRAWIRQEAQKQKTSETFTGRLDQQALGTLPYSPGLGTHDIEALAFLVMMAASKSANEDLKSVMSDVKTLNAAKSAVRQSSTQQVSEVGSLRLQMSMDRRSKLMTTLSNMMKKMSETESGIVQNMK